ncbi:MAG: PorV/PorQ family protein [Candidatus Eisenbacteria bacterium]
MSRARAWGGLVLPFALVVAAPLPAAAQTKTGTTVGTFLLIEPNARVAGMGNAGASLGDGLEAFYYNPAAIGRATKLEVAVSHAEWIAGIDFNHLAVAYPLGGAGTLVGSVTALGSGDIDVRTVNQPLGTGERYNVADLAIGIGWGRPITDRFTIGAQVSWLQERIWNSTLSSAVFHLGTLYRVSDGGLELGASLSNLGVGGRFAGRDLRITYDDDPDQNGGNGALPAEIFTEEHSVPVLLRFGLGFPYKLDATNRLRFGIDALHPSDNSESLNLGVEYGYKELFALRGGWQHLLKEDAEGGLTLGAGLRGDMNNSFGYRFDYAFADMGRLEATHRLTLGFDFQ